jgi:hypothetical protein
MKLIKFLPILGLLFANPAQSQEIIFQSAPNDIQQIVTNIFGLQCQNIGTVAVTGAPVGFGIFSNGQAIGLNSGIVLSTGNVFSDTSYNADYFSSTSFGTAGDVNIDQLNTGALSYDALSIGFQFTPTITDTVRFNYVFASEEYPEFSTSNYNDRFLFLVSENNGPTQNIAVLPNGTIVQINSINQFVNTNYYVDNSATSATYQDFVFDGYTVPLQAMFYASAGSTYTIKLVIADVADGVFDSAIFLDEQGSFSTISGNLAVGGNPAQDGVIQIFDAAEDSTVVNPLYTVPVTNGTYSVDSIPGGNYHVRYLPDLVLNPSAMPSYFTNGTTWSTADLIGLPCFFNSTDLNSTSVSLTGPGSVSGTIYIDSSFQKSLPLPCPNAVVLVRDVNSGEFVDYTKSDIDGHYNFENLPYGEYQILLDVPYMPQLDTITFVIAAGATHGGNINHSIETDGIHSELSTLGLGENALNFNIVPNPSKGEITIKSEGLSGMNVQIFEINGQLVYTGKMESNIQKLDVSSLRAGAYFVKIGNENKIKTSKLILMD